MLSVGIGTVVGILAGHSGGWVAAVLMRVTDWFLVLPTLVLAIALSTCWTAALGTIILAIGVTRGRPPRGWCARRRWPSRPARTSSGRRRSAAGTGT